MKRLLILALATGFAACSPDVPTSPDLSVNFVEAEFDPAHSVIPLPNDLVFLDAAGKIQPTLQSPTTGGTDAQNEFNRDYLNHLDGFPLESSASMLFDKPIDLASVKLFNGANPTEATLAVFDLKKGLPVTNLTVSVADAPNNGQTLNFIPPGGFWERGGQYAVLVLGGANGIKGKTSGQTVTGSPTFDLITSSTPLLTCDASGNNCIPTTSAIPTTEKDPAAQLDQQVALARQLEALRASYKPILDGAQAAIPGLKRTDIALVWTFTITSQAEVTFDPANSTIPFPNDILFVDPATGTLDTKLHLPVPPDAGALTDLYTGLNTLDGFSNTAPIVSENGDGTGPLIQGRVDAASVLLGATGTMNLLPAGAGKGALPTTTNGAVKAHACVNCPPIVMTEADGGPILLPDGGLKPDTLAIVPDVPLTERTQYAAYITTDLKDTTGKNVIASPVFALVRSSAPLFDGTHSTVSLLNDAQAQQLEALRSGLKLLFDQLALNGLPRTKVALAWAFTTQSTVTTLSQLHGAPFAATQIPDVPLWIQAIPPPGGGIPATNVGAWYVGEILDVFALTDPRGVINADTTKWTAPKMSFVMTVPNTTTRPQPTNGYPVTIFGHGLGGNRTNAFAIAASLASATPDGQVMIAIDETWHGDRNTCSGFGAYLAQAGVPAPIAQDLYACVNPAPPGTPTQTCNEATGRCQLANRNDPGLVACNHTLPDADQGCLLAGQGRCAPDDKCEAGAFAATFSPGGGVNIPVNGWKLINLVNFFASRDNLRQQVISDAQLARVVSSATTGNLGQQAGIQLDPTKISYVGQSLGGIMGTIYTAVAPEVRNAALNVPGGDVPGIIFNSPAFGQLRTAFDQGLAAQGIPANSPTYDLFVGTITRWIIDPADPLNAGPYLVRDTGLSGGLANQGSTRRGFVQWVLNDQVVPNPNTVELIRAIVGDPNASGVLLRPSDTGGVANFWAKQWTSTANHGFLLVGPDAAAAQAEVVTFISGAAPF
jgi:hypothetical protein